MTMEGSSTSSIPDPAPAQAGTKSLIPLWLKCLYTGFVAVLVPVYLMEYGPTNFLYFCDVALLMTLVAIWREDALWASMAAVGILLPQLVWMVDFLGGFFGFHLVGMTSYMFDPKYTLFTRALSFFHFWLPILLVYLVWRLGYDRRALVRWTLLAWFLLTICYFCMPAPPAPSANPNLPVNINYVYGMSEKVPQSWLPPNAFFLVLMVGLPLLIYLPTHWILNQLFHKGQTPNRSPTQADPALPSLRESDRGHGQRGWFAALPPQAAGNDGEGQGTHQKSAGFRDGGECEVDSGVGGVPHGQAGEIDRAGRVTP